MGIMQCLIGGSYTDRITLSNWTINDLVGFPTSASASYQSRSAGTIRQVVGGVTTVLETWLLNTPNVALYEIRITVLSGTLTTSSGDGVWLNLSTSRAWSVTQTGVSSNFCSFLVEIREASSGVIRASATIDLAAEVI